MLASGPALEHSTGRVAAVGLRRAGPDTGDGVRGRAESLPVRAGEGHVCGGDVGAELLLAAAFGAEGHSRDGPQPGGRVRRDSHPAVLLAPVPLSLCAENKERLRGELDQGEGAEP